MAENIVINPATLDATADTDSYFVVVVFMRSKINDGDEINKMMAETGKTHETCAAIVLAQDLQEAYDDLGLSGNFQCHSTVIDGKVTSVLPAGRDTVF